MAGSLYQRARFMAGLLGRIALRALPQRPPQVPFPASEALIEAFLTGDTAVLDAAGPGLATARDGQGNPWFCVALEVGGQATADWFLHHGANPAMTDRSGRPALEVVITRAAAPDEFDDLATDCPAIVAALIAAGASPTQRNPQGQSMAELAKAAGLPLGQP